MHKVIVIRHSDEDNQSSKYVANLQKNEDGSYSASVGVVKEDGYNDYVSKHDLHFTKALQESSFVDGWQTLQERRKIQIGINSNNL